MFSSKLSYPFVLFSFFDLPSALQVQIVKHLLSEIGMDPNAVNKKGSTALDLIEKKSSLSKYTTSLLNQELEDPMIQLLITQGQDHHHHLLLLYSTYHPQGTINTENLKEY
ncbi:hypothetical protein Dimus_027516 [Dionaea muscipula]